MTTPHRQEQSAVSTLITFQDFLYGDDEGWCEVWAGVTHPTKPHEIELIPPKRHKRDEHRWWWHERSRKDAIARYCYKLIVRYGNVYISRGLFDRPARPKNGGVPLPSRIVFVDDAPPEPALPYSGAVQTSATSQHAYYRLDQPADAPTCHDLQARAAGCLHADASGADVEQLVRVPGSFNTKHHDRQSVTLQTLDGPCYSADAIRTAYQAAPPPAEGGPASIDWAAVDRWLGNLEQLLNPAGLPWRVAKRECSQTYRILTGQQAWHKKDGRVGDSSRIRYRVADGLIRYFGYPDTALAAMLLHWGNFEHLGGDSAKGTREIKEDIARVIGILRAEYPDAKVTPIVAILHKPAKPAEETPRRRKGRPRVINADGYLEWLEARIDANGTVMQTQREIAAEHGISVETVRRLERQLRVQNLIERRTYDHRRRSCVVVLGAVKNQTAQPEIAAVAVAAPALEVLSEPPRNMDARAQGEEHTAPAAPPVAPSAAGGVVPVPRAPAVVIHEPVVAMPVGADEWSQSAIGPLPRRQRVADRPPFERLQVLKAQLGKVRGKKRKAKRQGADWLAPPLERAAADIQDRIAVLEAEIAAEVLSPPPDATGDLAEQLTIDAAPVAGQGSGGVCSPPPADGVPRSAAGGERPLFYLTGLEDLPAVRNGSMPPDDAWLELQRALQRQAEQVVTS
jgi:hypothetical protein